MEVVEGSCHSSHRYAYSGSLIDYVWGCALTGTIVVEALVGLASLLAVGVGLEVGQLGEGVGLEVVQLGEGVGAVWMATLVRLVPGVSADGGAGAGHHWVALMGLWHDKHGGSGAGEGGGREEGGKGKYWERWEEGSERGEEDSGRGPGATERVRVVRNLEKGGGARRKEEGGWGT